MQHHEFTHIHCSSKHGGNSAALESDLDDWMQRSSIITLTEIDNDGHAAHLREPGWRYANATQTQGQDECAVAWDNQVWLGAKSVVRKLTDYRSIKGNGRPAVPVHACSVLLRHRQSGLRLLVSVTHMPAHVEGPGGWRTADQWWRARKRAYMGAMHGWSTHVKDLSARWRPDGVVVTSDYNLNLKNDWVRRYLRDNWPDAYKIAWTHFPTEGSFGGRMIDGSMYRGLLVADGPTLMGGVRSSDHRPISETFGFLARGEHPPEDDPDSGDTQNDTKAPPWWGFADYHSDDEVYALARAMGESGGEVL